MAKLIKGSKAAKAFMAKIRAKKAPKKSSKKVSGVKESAKLKKELAAKKLRLPHGYETIKRTRKKKKLSGVKKNSNVKISVSPIYDVNDLQKLRDITEKQITETILRNNELNFEIKNGFYTKENLKDARLSFAKSKIHLQYLKFTLKKLNDRILKNIK